MAGGLGANLAISALLVALTAMIHMGFLYALGRTVMRADRRHHSVVRVGAILGAVLGLMVAHGVEITVYAIAYMGLGLFQTWEEALYFSTSTFTTVGFGDMVLDPQWRLLSGVQSLNGFLLIGWSTAFLIDVTARLRSFDLTHSASDG